MTLENARQSHENGEMSVMRVVVDLPEEKTGLLQVYNMPARDEAVLLGPYCGYEGDGLDGKSISRGQEALQRGVQKLMSVLKDYPGFENARVMFVPDVGVRETRHIVGKYVMTGLDVVAGRDFVDSIACGGHPVDVHPLPPEVEHMPMNHWRFHIPYRIWCQKRWENLLVAGRCVSATRMASGSLRTTVQCMATGEAAGLAAAMSAAAGISPAAIDGRCAPGTAEARGRNFVNGKIGGGRKRGLEEHSKWVGNPYGKLLRPTLYRAGGRWSMGRSSHHGHRRRRGIGPTRCHHAFAGSGQNLDRSSGCGTRQWPGSLLCGAA